MLTRSVETDTELRRRRRRRSGGGRGKRGQGRGGGGRRKRRIIWVYNSKHVDRESIKLVHWDRLLWRRRRYLRITARTAKFNTTSLVVTTFAILLGTRPPDTERYFVKIFRVIYCNLMENGCKNATPAQAPRWRFLAGTRATTRVRGQANDNKSGQMLTCNLCA